MKTFFTNLKIIAFALVLAIGASYVSAQTGSWSDPSGTPPSNNVDVPIHAGIADQVKQGSLSVNAFIAAQNAQFDQQLFLQGMVRGGTPSDTNSTVYFGGTDSNGVSRVVDIIASGGLKAKEYLRSDALVNNTASTICADREGNLILCTSGGGGGGGGGGTPGTPTFEIVATNACNDLDGRTSGTVDVATMTKALVMYEMRALNAATGTQFTWNAERSAPIVFASTCNTSAKDSVACVIGFDEGLSPGYAFTTDDISVTVRDSSGTLITSVIAPSVSTLPIATYCK